MPAPKPAQIREQVIELAKAGHSVRAIEAILAKRKIKVGKSTVAELVKLARAGKLPEASTKAAAPKLATPPAPATSRAPAPAMPGRALGDETPLDPSEVADLDIEELVKLSRLLDKSMTEALAEGDTRVAGWVLGARRTLSQEIARLRPPTPPDPAKDPANLAARDELRGRLARAVSAYQASAAGVAQLRAHVARVEQIAGEKRP